MNQINQSPSTMAQQIARAASAFERERTGHVPRSVTVVLSDTTLVVTLHGALSPAEQALARSPAGAAQIQEFHKRCLAIPASRYGRRSSASPGWRCARRPRRSRRRPEPSCKCFTTGTVVQVFLLARDVPADTWSSNGPGDLS